VRDAGAERVLEPCKSRPAIECLFSFTRLHPEPNDSWRGRRQLPIEPRDAGGNK